MKVKHTSVLSVPIGLSHSSHWCTNEFTDRDNARIDHTSYLSHSYWIDYECLYKADCDHLNLLISRCCRTNDGEVDRAIIQRVVTFPIENVHFHFMERFLFGSILGECSLLGICTNYKFNITFSLNKSWIYKGKGRSERGYYGYCLNTGWLHNTTCTI